MTTTSTSAYGSETATAPRSFRFAAVGDLHCKKSSAGEYRELFAQASKACDALLLCGDLTDYGLPDEAHVLAEELSAASIPVIAVFGNHDFESDQQIEVCRILSDAGVQMLDGEACIVHGVGIAGVKGFAGGFGPASLGPWGEKAIKAFVQEAIHESIKLEAALARLRTEHRIAVLHYSPTEETVRGEPAEIYPFLGSSRLAEPLVRYPVDVVVHGHAHRGAPEGKLVDGTPVFNVAMPLLRRTYPDRPAFHVLQMPAVVADHSSASGASETPQNNR
jgi:Icc-related predicted phosphoesterase